MTPYRQRGLSLIELLISLGLGIVVLLGVTQIFIHTLLSDRVATAAARAQETGRAALDTIARDARRAGYIGCLLPNQAFTSAAPRFEFPADAIAVTPRSLTVRYAQSKPELGPGSNVAGVVGKDCGGANLYLYQVTYSNGACSVDPKKNCIKIARRAGTNINDGRQDLVDNATLDAIQVGITRNGLTVWKSPIGLTRTELENIRQVRIDVTATAPSQNISRSFSSTITLRNRL